MRSKITQAFVDTAKAAPNAERTVYWDEGMPGFGLMVTAAGHRSFVVQYRTGRRSRRMTIDGVLSVVQARKQAKSLLGEVAKEKDPLEERRRAKTAAQDTFKSIAEEYLKRESKNLRSIQQRRATLERLVFPKFGSRQID